MEKLMELSNRGQQSELQDARKRLKEATSRLKAVEAMAQKLFEERCTGNVPDNIFKNLMQGYEAEQDKLNQLIAEKQNAIMELENQTMDISDWAEELKQYTHIEKLDRHIVTTLIDNVQVHKSTKEDGIIKQCITVNYKFVGELSA